MIKKRNLLPFQRWASVLFSLSSCALALLGGGRLPAATFTYPVNEKLLCSASCFVTFAGTLRVDQLGSNLDLADLSDWNLQLIDNTDQKLQTFQPSDSSFKLAGSPVIDATPAELTMTLNKSIDNLALVGLSNTQWIFSGGQSDPTELMLIPNGSVRLASKSFDGFPATITATAAPEPNSNSLLAMTIACGLWWSQGRRCPHLS